MAPEGRISCFPARDTKSIMNVPTIRSEGPKFLQGTKRNVSGNVCARTEQMPLAEVIGSPHQI